MWLTVSLCLEGPPLAIDTTLDGSPHLGAAERDGVVLETVRRRKERTVPGIGGTLAVELAWWCSLWKLGAGGQLRPGLSFPTWPRHDLEKRCLSCSDAQNERGA